MPIKGEETLTPLSSPFLQHSKFGPLLEENLERSCMGDSPAWTVVTGTVIVSVASTCLTGLYATFSTGGKRLNHGHLATASAFNSAVTAATFFTIREYVVSPIFAAVERRGTMDENNRNATDSLSWTGLRGYNLLDSGVSGAATGGLLRGLTSGQRAVAPAAITAGTVCVLLQAVYNELRVQRIKYVAQLSKSSEIVVELPKPSLKSRILGSLGVKQLSDEELLGKFKRERDKHLKRIQELEADIEEERKRNV